MNSRNKFNFKIGCTFLGIALVTLFLSNCSKNEAPPAQNEAPTAAATPAAEVAADAPKPKDTPDQTVEIASNGDELKYDKIEIVAKAGSTLKVVFKNNAVKSNMPHNFVVVKPGSDAEIAQAGIAAGDGKSWIPDSPNVIAHTTLVAPGKTDSISFVVPAAGEYPYICTYPGHSMTMRGVLKSK